MTISINTLTNNSTFGEWKDITNAMGDGFDKVLTLDDVASLNDGNLALTGNITSTTGTLSVGTITHGTVADEVTIDRKTNIAQTLKIVNSGAVAELSFAQNNSAIDDWRVATNSTHTELIIQKASGGTDRTFTFNSTNGQITASGFTFDSVLVPQTITGNAGTATKWTDEITITLGQDATGSVSFDGSANVTLDVTVADNSHDHTQGNITGLGTALDAKLAITGGTLTGNTTLNTSKKLYFGSSGNTNRTSFYNTAAKMITDLGDGGWKIQKDASNYFTFAADGQFTASNDITAFSDRTLKENIVSIPNALDKVCAIGGYTFDRTDIVRDRQTGVIAQEVLEVLPEAVHQNEDGIYSVAYGNMVGLLVEAIKELKSEVDELRSNA